MPLTWLVTGCTSGIGEAFVRGILARGDKVIATARGDTSRLSGLAEAGAKTFSLDVTATQSEINAVVGKILEGGPIDVVVNNAGYIEAAMVEEASYESYLAQFEINLFGVIKVTKAILPHFREKKSGTNVLIGSTGGIAGELGVGAYCSTKFALSGWCDSLRQETAHLNIKCVLFELGHFRTNIMHPNNMKVFRDSPITDYDDFRKLVRQGLEFMNGKQAGSPEKAVEVMIDVVKGEGVAEGKVMPERLPLGTDVLATARKRCREVLAVCDEWEDVIKSTDF